MFQTNNPGLLIIDVQKAIDSYSTLSRNNETAELVIADLLNYWRNKNLPIFHIRHASKFESSPYHESSKSFQFKKEVAPLDNEVVITKRENIAFINTNLNEQLISANIKELVVCGVLINNSVDATVRLAAGLGYNVYLPADATAAFEMELLNGERASAESVHLIFLSNLHKEYCHVCESQDIFKNI